MESAKRLLGKLIPFLVAITRLQQRCLLQLNQSKRSVGKLLQQGLLITAGDNLLNAFLCWAYL